MAFLMMVMPNNLVLNGKVNFDPFDKKSVTLTSYFNEYCISNITEKQWQVSSLIVCSLLWGSKLLTNPSIIHNQCC